MSVMVLDVILIFGGIYENVSGNGKRTRSMSYVLQNTDASRFKLVTMKNTTEPFRQRQHYHKCSKMPEIEIPLLCVCVISIPRCRARAYELIQIARTGVLHISRKIQEEIQSRSDDGR